VCEIQCFHTKIATKSHRFRWLFCTQSPVFASSAQSSVHPPPLRHSPHSSIHHTHRQPHPTPQSPALTPTSKPLTPLALATSQLLPHRPPHLPPHLEPMGRKLLLTNITLYYIINMYACACTQIFDIFKRKICISIF
jgi:hypothetical protein